MKEEKPKEPVPPKLPPEPVSTWQPPQPIPVERPGQGVNKKVKKTNKTLINRDELLLVCCPGYISKSSPLESGVHLKGFFFE